MAHVISTRLNDEIYSEISNMAHERHRKVSEIFQEAIQAYLEDYSDYHIALDRLKDPRDEVMTEEEFSKLLKQNQL